MFNFEEKIQLLIDNGILNKVKYLGSEQIQSTCPFHSETNPSFGLNLKTEKYNCFSCGEHGNSLIDFLQKIEKQYKIKLLKDEEESILNIMNYKIQRINFVKENEQKISYLDEKALNGYDDQDGEYIINRVSREEIRKLFEIKYNKKENQYIMPIRHYNKKLVGTVIRQFIEPKYKYNYGFDKRLTLFGIDKIKGNLGIITEGHFDVINAYNLGYNDCVGIMGAKMSEEQEKIILNYFDEIIIATDNDEAGKNAAIDIEQKLKNKIKIKKFSWISNKKDLGELTKNEFDKEMKNLL